MKQLTLCVLLTLLFAGGLSAQWGDCWTYDINRHYPSISDPYEDADGNGCRDDSYQWYVHFNSMLMNGAAATPYGSYHRVMVEIIGNDTYDYNSTQVLKTVEMNPDNFQYRPGGTGGVPGYYGIFQFRMDNAPVRY